MTEAVSPRNGRWSMESMLGPAGARALLAAVGTAGVVASVPAVTLGHWIAASGLGMALPLLAPPLALATRLALAAAAGLVAGVLIFIAWRTLHRKRAPARSTAQGDSMKDKRPAQHKKKEQRKGWSASFGALFRRKSTKRPATAEAQPRRRADLHPDAPPRPPLLASRDLPPPGRPAEAGAATAPVLMPAPSSLPRLDEIVADSGMDILDDTPVAPRPFEPRETPQDAVTINHPAITPQPAPSQSDYNGPRVFEAEPAAATAMSETPSAPPPAEEFRPSRFEPARALVNDAPIAAGNDGLGNDVTFDTPRPDIPAPMPDETMIDQEQESLASLLARFEHGLARRVAVVDARSAETLLNERLIFAEPDSNVRNALRSLRPVESVAPPPVRPAADPAALPLEPLDQDVDSELEAALGALRRLTEQGRR